MELELALALPTSAPSKGLNFDLNDGELCSATTTRKMKRGFTDAFGDDVDANAALSLFLCSPTHDDKRNNNGHGGRSLNANDNGGFDGGGLVGWPPVKSAWRNCGGGVARYVKVKMEGVAIGRKVDLSLHRSYTTLLDALDGMFTGKAEEGETGGLGGDGPPAPPPASRRNRTFTYQDCDGDWMLLGDVPWETFIKSVKRLKILNCGE